MGSMISAASVTRNVARVSGAKCLSATLPITKLIDQEPTITAIRLARTAGWGRWLTALGKDLLARGELLDAVEAWLVADARPGGHADGAAGRDLHLRLDDVGLPVAPAGGDVARQGEAGECRKRDIVRAADARLQHPAAPHRDAARLAEIV